MSTPNMLAIDPGASGGFAWIKEGQVNCCAMPDTPGEILDKLRELRIGIQTAIVEEQHGFVAPGLRIGGSAMFTFGCGYGFILGVLQTLGYRVELVRPMRWQKHLALGTKKDAGGSKFWKHKLRAEAQRRFPGVDVTLKTADCLLILDYSKQLTP